MNAPLPEHLLPEIRQRETPLALIDALKARFGTMDDGIEEEEGAPEEVPEEDDGATDLDES